MKPMTVVGVLVVVLGLVAFAYQSITYTSRDTIIDIGPLHATAERQKTVRLPPVLGIAAVVIGAGLLIASARTRT
jgi:membrane-bound ClpP family serine protease